MSTSQKRNNRIGEDAGNFHNSFHQLQNHSIRMANIVIHKGPKIKISYLQRALTCGFVAEGYSFIYRHFSQ